MPAPALPADPFEVVQGSAIRVEKAAGFNDVVYEPQNALSDDKKSYTQKAGNIATKLSTPLPFSLEYWAGPGDEPVMLKVASAYEAATHHRRPPAAFPALKGEP